MLHRRLRFVLLLPVLVGLALLGACSSPVTIKSRSMTEAPSVDGALDDWGGNLSFVDGTPVSMSATPTDSLLYVALVIQDRSLIRTVMSNGLRVWIDPTGGQQQTYGIQYPLGLRAQRTGQQDPSPKKPDRSRSASVIDQVDLSQLAIVRPDSTRRRIPAHFSSGLQAKATLDPGSLVYELAVPVSGAPNGTAGREHGLKIPLASTVGIGLETPKPEEDESNAPDLDTGTPSVTGRPGRGRTRPGRRRQRPRQKLQRKKVPQLDLWTKVVTADAKK